MSEHITNTRETDEPTTKAFATQLQRAVISATVVFVNIPLLKEREALTGYAALVGLHNEIAASFAGLIGSRLNVLSALTGAIAVIPDDSALYIHHHLTALGQSWANLGIPVRIGVVHGEIEILSDVDGMMNAIGQPVNIAARLACQRDRPGCILHSSYLDFVKGLVDSGGFLGGAKAISLAGKAHDSEKMRGKWIAQAAFPTVEIFDANKLPKMESTPPTINAVAIAYDLPKFSAGDRSELSKRFRAVADTFDSLRANGDLGETERLYFSPGGDGGIIVLRLGKRLGYIAAERIASALVRIPEEVVH